jgi:hypothetical protein
MPILSKKNTEQERDEQFKMLATNLEILNQRISSGGGGGGSGVDLSGTERLIDSQHNYIVQTIKQLEERVVKTVEANNVSGQLTKEEQNLINAIRTAGTEIINEVRKNNIFSELNKGEQSIVQEIKKSYEFSIALNKNLPVLFDLLKETIRLLREQNQLLRQK